MVSPGPTRTRGMRIVSAKSKNRDEYAELRELLKHPRLWPAAAEVLRSKLNASDLSRGEIERILGVSQPTVARFMAGSPTPRALLKKLHGLNRLLEHLDLTVGDLDKLAHAVGMLLCIDRPEEGFDSIECASIHFHTAGDHAVPFPMDPRTDPQQTNCGMCGGPLSAACPECQKPVVAASHCPQCGHRYVAGAPEELRGLTGKQLVQACEKRNAANRTAMQHVEGGLPT